ncbi:serine/threonine-protein kinase, partial [Acrocarpospora catenulata]|uniref:serine/threonine-protein kinase n=1 Tax=Acrocarpospora catenulata TaxID=2836182 RepID=UPI001BDAC521
MPEIVPLRAGDPESIGGYGLRGRLGEGGQGVVYLGTASSGEEVAVKLLRADLAADPMMRERFLREVSAAKRVAPFCTAQLIDTGLYGEQPYIVSEYIEGATLQQRIASGPLNGPALHRLAVGTATALATIHQAGIVHRDFKPANVIMGPDGPRVIDFGIAKALDGSSTMTSQPVGTPAYMAPEQILGHQVGPQADLFAWACTILFAATGTTPFGNDTLPAVINRILNQTPTTETLEGRLREVVDSCLNKDPRARPTAEQVLLRLLQHSQPNATMLMEAAAAASQPITPPPGQPAPPPPPPGGNVWATPHPASPPASTRQYTGPQPPPPPPTRQYTGPQQPPSPPPPSPGSYGMPPVASSPAGMTPVGNPPPPYPPRPVHQLGTQVSTRRQGNLTGPAILAAAVALVVVAVVVVFVLRDGGDESTNRAGSSSAPRTSESTPTPTPSPTPTPPLVTTK